MGQPSYKQESSQQVGQKPREGVGLPEQVEEAFQVLEQQIAGMPNSQELLHREIAELHAQLITLQCAGAQHRAAVFQARQEEAKYRGMFENATIGIFQTTMDGHYLSCNPALATIYGYASPDELKASVKDIKRQLYVDDATRPRFVRLMQQNDRVSGFEARIFRKDGQIIWISETARAVRDHAGVLLFYEGFVTDITARKEAEEALRESEERYTLAIKGANDGLWDWNLRSGEIHFSARWKEMLGVNDEQIGTQPEEWFSRVHPEDLQSLQAAITAHRDGVTPHFEVEHRMLHRDGGYRWMLARGAAIRDGANRATRIAGSQTDITQRKETEEQLLRDALHDGLTGLPNRVLFNDRLERSIARTKRDVQHHFAVLFLDVDRFKVINDSLGHGVGDQLLIAVANRLQEAVRPGDTVARLGGDEFTILLEDPQEPDDAVSVAQRIIQAVKQPFHLETREVFVTTSIGIALSSAGYQRPQDVLRDADTAMYRAKAQGRSGHQVFDATMHTRAVKLLELENDLRRAIDRQEFELFYQPILLIKERKLKGFEALVRWRHPQRGIVSPTEFVPIAEETGLILPIGRWVLNEACRQMAEWQRQFPDNPMDINVNLSGRQLSQTDMVEQVMQALRQSGLKPQHLILEITESVVMENPESSIAMFERLKALGIQINIDDFGTGYSSLAYLQKFPVDTMKIDRSFISRIGQDPENAEIVRTIVALAHGLNIKVTAEGIETEEQLEKLASLSCENAQGYLFSKPLSHAMTTDLLNQQFRGQMGL